EVVLRVDPVPPASTWLVAQGADPLTARRAVWRPSAVLWDGTSTWVHLEGHAADVAAETAQLAHVGAFSPTDGPPPLPPHRWSSRPSRLAVLDTERTGAFVACVGTGLVHAERPAPARPVAAAVAALAERVRAQFDPQGRLNPGR